MSKLVQMGLGVAWEGKIEGFQGTEKDRGSKCQSSMLEGRYMDLDLGLM